MSNQPDKNGKPEHEVETKGKQSPRDSSEEKSKSKNENDSNPGNSEEDEEEFILNVDQDKAIAKSKDPEQLRKVFAYMKYWFPPIHILLIIAMLVIVIIYSLFKGGRGTESLVGIESCSGGFAGLLIAFLIITVAFTILTGWMLFKETESWNA